MLSFIQEAVKYFTPSCHSETRSAEARPEYGPKGISDHPKYGPLSPRQTAAGLTRQTLKNHFVLVFEAFML